MFVKRGIRVVAVAICGVAIAAPVQASAAQISREMRVAMGDGVTLHATLTGAAPLTSRPVIVEFSPYGPGSGTTYDGPAYNYVLVQIRGTGDSDGRFDALGPRTQADVVQTLRWACHQPWSDGRLALNGFSASAITIYNSLHLTLPCVRAAVLKSGTFELYRDLLWPGGISNLVPGAGVLALIGAPALLQGPARLQRNPSSGLDTIAGLTQAGFDGGLLHPTLDWWWRERGFRGEAQHLPILMIDGFFDVESRGAFEAYRQLKGDGAQLLVIGAHDSSPAGTDGGVGAAKDWFDHHVLGAANGVERRPKVQLWLPEGSRESYLAGRFVRYDAGDWPVPGTGWRSLWLDAAGGGSLTGSRPSAAATQSYATLPSVPTFSDVPNSGIAGPAGLNALAKLLPQLTETNLAEPLALTYTSKPLTGDVVSAGPASLELRLSSTAPETDIWAVICDVWPDGSSHPITTGRLRSSYPGVIASRSLLDAGGDIVEPYGDYSAKSYATPLSARTYRVEFWPVGNRFSAGHRIRLVILGPSAAALPAGLAINSVQAGGPGASRLLLPVLPAR
jgi:predicted acyl esterase